MHLSIPQFLFKTYHTGRLEEDEMNEENLYYLGKFNFQFADPFFSQFNAICLSRNF